MPEGPLSRHDTVFRGIGEGGLEPVSETVPRALAHRVAERDVRGSELIATIALGDFDYSFSKPL
jgi:hypothetical protein